MNHIGGKRLSELMIQSAILYARELGYEKVHIMSGEIGLYEKYGFEKLGLNRIVSYCNEDNIASIKVNEKLGYEFVGTVVRKNIDGKTVVKMCYELTKNKLRCVDEITVLLNTLLECSFMMFLRLLSLFVIIN